MNNEETPLNTTKTKIVDNASPVDLGSVTIADAPTSKKSYLYKVEYIPPVEDPVLERLYFRTEKKSRAMVSAELSKLQTAELGDGVDIIRVVYVGRLVN